MSRLPGTPTAANHAGALARQQAGEHAGGNQAGPMTASMNLVEAVRLLARGEALPAPAVTRRVIELFARMPAPRDDAALADLSPRELEVLRLLAQGRSNAQIAGELVVSAATVKTHVSNVLAKLRLPDRVQAVIFAYETGLVRPGAA